MSREDGVPPWPLVYALEIRKSLSAMGGERASLYGGRDFNMRASEFVNIKVGMET